MDREVPTRPIRLYSLTIEMRIGIDVSLLLYPEVAGMRLYLERLLTELLEVGAEHEFLLFCHSRRAWRGVEAITCFQRPNAHIVLAPLLVRCVPDSAWWLGLYPRLEHVLPEPVDVFHAGNFFFPTSTRTPIVATLHDLTPVLFPDLHVWPNRIRHWRQMRWLATHAQRIISDSHATAVDFRRCFGGVTPIDVIHLGVGQDVSRDDPEHPGRLAKLRDQIGLGSAPYVLSVGTIEPRKNGQRLVQAFDRLAAEGMHDAHLVFAGRRGWHSEPIYAAARQAARANRIHFADHLPVDDLAALYRGATAFAYPSLYEGFGLPVLEAMSAGVPVLTSRVSSLPEVVGDAALLVDPLEVDAIAAGLQRLLQEEELRLRLSTAGRARSAQFTWSEAARRTLETYRRAIDSPHRP
jgi:glycosyltransferase involved in cell wall biosynthesis